MDTSHKEGLAAILALLATKVVMVASLAASLLLYSIIISNLILSNLVKKKPKIIKEFGKWLQDPRIVKSKQIKVQGSLHGDS